MRYRDVEIKRLRAYVRARAPTIAMTGETIECA
jgi:hypothetical protein